MLAAANSKKEKQESPAGGSIIDDIIQTANTDDSEAVKKDNNGASIEEKSTVKADNDNTQAAVSKRKKETAHKQTPVAAGEESGAVPQISQYGNWDSDMDLTSRLKKKVKAERKSVRTTFAMYPSVVERLKKESQEIGCSLNDLVNGILSDWVQQQDK